MNGHFYEVELLKATYERAKVRVFIPDGCRTREAQQAFAEAQALADEAWGPDKITTSVSSLSQKERVSISAVEVNYPS